jgi:hypothetical protein
VFAISSSVQQSLETSNLTAVNENVPGHMLPEEAHFIKGETSTSVCNFLCFQYVVLFPVVALKRGNYLAAV